MKIGFRKLLFMAAALPILLLGASAQAAMTDAEIKAALSGKSFAYSGPGTGTLEYHADGKLTVVYDKSGRMQRKTGSWFTRGNKLCSKLVRRDSKGKKTVKCYTLNSAGDGKIKSSDGILLTPK